MLHSNDIKSVGFAIPSWFPNTSFTFYAVEWIADDIQRTVEIFSLARHLRTTLPTAGRQYSPRPSGVTSLTTTAFCRRFLVCVHALQGAAGGPWRPEHPDQRCIGRKAEWAASVSNTWWSAQWCWRASEMPSWWEPLMTYLFWLSRVCGGHTFVSAKCVRRTAEFVEDQLFKRMAIWSWVQDPAMSPRTAQSNI